jgi:hypothetical protein
MTMERVTIETDGRVILTNALASRWAVISNVRFVPLPSNQQGLSLMGSWKRFVLKFFRY